MDSKKRILLADGDDVFRDLLRETLLKEPDFEIVGETGDGEEAVELCRRLSPDLLVMDLMLTQMDGLDVLDALGDGERPPVLVLSALVRGNTAEAALNKGASYCQMKPCKLSSVVDRVRRAVQHLEQEAHLFTGFVRFSELDGVLAGEITPKNRVLPLLRPHFCGRLPQERFLLYDKTHREALVHMPGKWAILPAEDFQMGPAGEEELRYRAMWRKFYDTIAIEGRYNPRCRMTQMPKRYWGDMTEFQREDSLPPRPGNTT